MAYLTAVAMLLQEGDDGSGAAGALGAMVGLVLFAIYFGILAILIASMWKLFTKAGQPGWAALVPIYNLVVMLQIVNKPLWWIVLFLIPCANIVAAIMITIEIAKAFGKDVGYAIGMLLLPFIFYPMLAFGDAQYRPPLPQ